MAMHGDAPHCKAKRPGSLSVDDQLELWWNLDHVAPRNGGAQVSVSQVGNDLAQQDLPDADLRGR
jgi:hypothetical protein